MLPQSLCEVKGNDTLPSTLPEKETEAWSRDQSQSPKRVNAAAPHLAVPGWLGRHLCLSTKPGCLRPHSLGWLHPRGRNLPEHPQVLSPDVTETSIPHTRLCCDPARATTWTDTCLPPLDPKSWGTRPEWAVDPTVTSGTIRRQQGPPSPHLGAFPWGGGRLSQGPPTRVCVHCLCSGPCWSRSRRRSARSP